MSSNVAQPKTREHPLPRALTSADEEVWPMSPTAASLTADR